MSDLVIPAVRRPKVPLGPVVAAVLTVLALALATAPTLASSRNAGAPTDPGAPLPSPSGGGPVTVAPAFAPGASNTWVGPVPPSTSMNVVVGLASQDPTGLEAETAAEYTVGSGLYHHFLSPSEVAARYGPAPAAVAEAEQYFAGFGLSAQPLPGGSLLSVTGPASGVGSAFGTSFQEYRSASGRLFVSHPTPATLPAGIPWTGAVGLGNVSVPVPLAEPAAALAGSAGASPSASCTGGSSGLSPCEVWAAYDAAGLLDNGTNGSGTTIGVVDVYDGAEPQTELASDLAKFDSTFLLPAPAVSFDYPVPTSTDLNSTHTGWGLEEALDLEWAHAAAPGASLAMTFATDSNAGLYTAVNWLVAGARVNVLSLSWGEPDVGVYNAYAGPCTSACNASTDGSYEVLGPVLAAASLEGITVFSAAGDCGSADGTSGVSTNYPSSDPFVTGVGGTTLSVGAGGTWEGETAWSGNASGAVSPGCENQGGSGGGFAPSPRPWWQSGTGVPASPDLRGDPDVADDAGTPVEVVVGGDASGVLGTSVATPLWAGVASLADQYAGGPLGFLNPQLYALLRSPSYASDFHDITTGNNGAYAAGPGWDPVTGLGGPIVGALVPALTRSPPSTSSLQVGLAASPSQGTAPLQVSFFPIPTGGSGDYPLEGVSFGDGTAALVSNGSVSHVYLTDGTYAAVAYVADSSGNVSASAPLEVVVGGASLRVVLTVSDSTPAAGESVRFNASVTGGTAPYSYLFTFGDGTFLSGSPSNTTTHSFAVAGGYCADVVVNDSAVPQDGGTSALVPISVGGGEAPVCRTQVAPFQVTADSTPGVRDAPADYPSLFTVSGGEGVGAPTVLLSSSDPYVGACGCTIFRSPGTYSVTLQATNSSGTRASNETNVTVAPPLTGTFGTTTPWGDAPLTVTFNASVSGGYQANASRTQWEFGDGTSAAGATVSHTYTAAGTYFATGDAEDSGNGNASEGFLIDVLPAGDGSGYLASATIQPAVHVVAGTTVRFSAELPSTPGVAGGTLAPVLFNWSLGSGDSAPEAVTAATVYAPASGEVSAREFWLNVTWPFSHEQLTFPVLDPSFLAVQSGGFIPRADALGVRAGTGPGSGVAPLTWTGTATTSGPGTTHLSWSFGDGNSSTARTVAHQYGTPGEYAVTLAANDSWNDTATLPFGVAVHAASPPAIRASVSPLEGAAPLNVTLNASASGGAGAPYYYLWSFGNGGSNGTVVSRSESWVSTTTYSVGSPAGSASVLRYNLTLAVTDAQGDTARENWTVVVHVGGSGPTAAGSPWLLYLRAAALGLVLGGVGVIVYARRRRPPSPPPTPTP